MDCVCRILKVLVQSLTFNMNSSILEYSAIIIIIQCHIPQFKFVFVLRIYNSRRMRVVTSRSVPVSPIFNPYCTDYV